MSKNGNDSYNKLLSDFNTLQKKCDAQLDIINAILDGLQGIEEIGVLDTIKLDEMGINNVITYIQQSFQYKNQQIYQLQNELEILGNKGLQDMNAFCQYFNAYFVIVSNIIRDNAFYVPKNKTKNTAQNYIIEYHLFNQYISYFSGEIGNKRLLEIWQELGLIVPSESGKIAFTYTYEKKSVRACRLKKSVVDLVRECMIL